jgi:acetyltransferase-like isoleucine patch superfamily enzyme
MNILFVLSKYYNRTFLSRRFKYFGKNVTLIAPLKINGFNNMIIEDNVVINYKAWLTALPINPKDECSLKIGKGTNLGHFNHIYATKEIIIGENVLTADKVYIADNLHNYADPNIPVMHQGIKQVGAVHIGSGTWIGENACIIGVKIGTNCVIGANAVVTKDIPDYSIAVGIPARVIKKYDFLTNKWMKVNE